MGFIWVDDKDDDDKYKAELLKKINEATTALTATKDGLLTDIGKLKEEKKKYEGVDIAELQQTAADYDKLVKEKQGKETDAEKALRIATEQHQKDLKKLQDSVAALEGNNKALLVDEQLTKALALIKVKPVFLSGVIGMLKPKISVLSEDGKQVAKIGDKTIDEAVKAWAETDEGKAYVGAPINSGGGAGGGGSTTTAAVNEKYFKKGDGGAWNVTKQIQLKKTDPDLYKQLADKHLQKDD